MKTIILAGGAGTRLRSLVSDLPKPMASITGRPFLEYLIERLVKGGMTELVLSTGYRAEAISDHFGAFWGGATISYSIESQPLGTGGAVAYATAGWTEEPCWVVNGDTYTGVDFADLTAWAAAVPALALGMVLSPVEDTARYGAVHCTDGLVDSFAEKGPTGPGLINAGLYLLSPSVFARFGLSGRFSLETDLLQAHLNALRPRAYVTDSFFIDIGVPEDYIRAQTVIPRHANGA